MGQFPLNTNIGIGKGGIRAMATCSCPLIACLPKHLLACQCPKAVEGKILIVTTCVGFVCGGVLVVREEATEVARCPPTAHEGPHTRAGGCAQRSPGL